MARPCGCRYEAGALAGIWPLEGVVLSLHGPFLADQDLASTVLRDVSYPETPLVLRDLNLTWDQSVRPLRAAAKSRIRWEASRVLDSGPALTSDLSLQTPDLPERVLD